MIYVYTQAEREAYAELAEVAAQWQASAAWEARQRRSAAQVYAQFTRTIPGMPRPPQIEEVSFPLVRRKRRRPAWFDLAVSRVVQRDFPFSSTDARRSPRHDPDDPTPELPRPRVRSVRRDRARRGI